MVSPFFFYNRWISRVKWIYRNFCSRFVCISSTTHFHIFNHFFALEIIVGGLQSCQKSPNTPQEMNANATSVFNKLCTHNINKFTERAAMTFLISAWVLVHATRNIWAHDLNGKDWFGQKSYINRFTLVSTYVKMYLFHRCEHVRCKRMRCMQIQLSFPWRIKHNRYSCYITAQHR